MQMRLAPLLSAGLVVMLGVACQSAPAPAPTPEPRATPAPAATAAAPTQAAAPSAPPSAVAAPSPSVRPIASPSPIARPASPPSPLPTVAPPPSSASRIEVLNAAEAAFARGDAATAAALFERVTNTPPAPGEAAAASAAIVDYAHFRAAVALLAAGREDEARLDLDELQSRDASSPLARLGAQLWDQYGMTGQLRAACAQLQPQLASQAGQVLSTLIALGVNVDPTRVCSVP